MSSEQVFFSSLGSGSAGNAYVAEFAGASLLIDQGFSRKELINRMTTAGIAPETVCGALLSHDHSDHCKGSRVFCDTLSLPLYTTGGTALYLKNKKQLPQKVRVFEPGSSFEVGPFEVNSFPLPHDAVEPVGFTVKCGGCKIGIATDLGHPDENICRHLADCDLLVIESNYDRDMLMNSDRDINLKRRICGVRGHLSNLDTASLLPRLVSHKTRCLLLAHISSECNCPEIVNSCCQEALAHCAVRPERVEILSQHLVSERFLLTPCSEAAQ